MRRFSFRPALRIRGRKFKGPRGWAGKPLHPPLTDIPVAAYILAAVFDVISVVGRDEEWSRDFFRAATYVFIGGALVSVFAALTGAWDWWKSSEKGTQARRTINSHASIMILVTVLALTDIVLRLADYSDRTYPSAGIWVLSVIVALLVSVGSLYGGAMVYEYGFNVETAGDHPVWHQSETDVFHGQH